MPLSFTCIGFLCIPFGLYKGISKFPHHAYMRLLIHKTKTSCHNWQHGQHSSMGSVHLINIYREPRRSLAVYEVPATPTLTVLSPSAVHANGREAATSGWENVVFLGHFFSASQYLAISPFSHGLNLRMSYTQRYLIQSPKCVRLQDSLRFFFHSFGA